MLPLRGSCHAQVCLQPYGNPKTLLYYVLCPEHLMPLVHMFMRVSMCWVERMQ